MQNAEVGIEYKIPKWMVRKYEWNSKLMQQKD